MKYLFIPFAIFNRTPWFYCQSNLGKKLSLIRRIQVWSNEDHNPPHREIHSTCNKNRLLSFENLLQKYWASMKQIFQAWMVIVLLTEIIFWMECLVEFYYWTKVLNKNVSQACLLLPFVSDVKYLSLKTISAHIKTIQ